MTMFCCTLFALALVADGHAGAACMVFVLGVLLS